MCTALAERSLLVADLEAAEPRFRMLETVRAFAAEELRSRGEREEVRQRHADVYRGLAEAGADELGSGPQQVRWLDRCERELGNFREALRWAIEHDERDLGLRLAAALVRFWFVRGRWAEGEAWLRALLERADRTTAAAHARGLHAAGILLYARAAYAEATAMLDRALDRYGEAGDERGVALSTNALGMIARRQGRLRRAAILHHRALHILQRLGDRANVARSLENLGSVEMDRGTLASAERHCREAVAVFDVLAYAGGQAYTPALIAHVLVRSGDVAAAVEVETRARRLAGEVGYPLAAELSLLALARAAESEGHPDAARGLLVEALDQFGERGSQWSAAVMLDALAGLRTRTQPEAAAVLLGAADRLRRSIGAPVPFVDRPRQRRILAALRRRLGEGGLERAWQRAGEMPTPRCWRWPARRP